MNRQHKIEMKTKFSLAVLAAFLLLTTLAVATRAQSCSLRVVGAIANCQGASVLWSTSTSSDQIDRFDLVTYAGNYRVDAATHAFLIPSGCGSGGAVRVIEVRKNGTTCVLDYSGNLPHARPCDQCGNNGGGNRMATRHAASFRGDLAPGTIGAAFGDAPFTTVTQTASSTPLPTLLGGVRFLIDDQEVPLFFVSPSQVNFYAPEWLTEGLHSARAITPEGLAIYGDVLINKNSPGIFTIDANGTGQTSSVWLILSPNGLARYRTSVDALPGERVFLLLFGSGIAERVNYFGVTSGSATLRVVVNNQAKEFTAQFVGMANATVFIGLNQLNFEIQQADLWTGLAGAQLSVGNFFGQRWDSNGFSIRGR
jgi:uncharacterized protein (TIGR03437 family)